MVKLTESTVYIRTKTSVEAVKKINLWGCDIDDISLCEKMTSLEVLSLSVNKVTTLSSIRNCTNLRELYLRKNEIQSLSELEHLKKLKNLRVLWIDDNPCTQVGEYRFKVVKMLPQITKLDDKPVTSDDHMETPPDPDDSSVPEYDVMQTSMCSARSSRSGTIHGNSQMDLMSRSLYGRTIVDTVMPSQMVHYGDTSDEERTSVRCSRPNLMTQSVYGTLPEDEWGDFNVDEEYPSMSYEPMLTPRMCASMHESLDHCYMKPHSQHGYGRSISVPRRRVHSRKQSSSPARDQRLTKIMSAVSVLLDELDQEGLRTVIDEAQNRMKKQR